MKELITGWSSGKLDARNDKSGEVVFKVGHPSQKYLCTYLRVITGYHITYSKLMYSAPLFKPLMSSDSGTGH